MGDRSDLHDILTAITDNVYFQPPPNITMTYPCIVYRRDTATTLHADDAPYRYIQRYQIIVIDRDPDSEILPKIAALPMCQYNRFYTADQLNHDVYNLFF